MEISVRHLFCVYRNNHICQEHVSSMYATGFATKWVYTIKIYKFFIGCPDLKVEDMIHSTDAGQQSPMLESSVWQEWRLKLLMHSSFYLGVGGSNEGGMTGGCFTDSHGMVVMPR